MKRIEQVAQLHKMSLSDVKGEVTRLEKEIQAHRVALAFGKSKQVSTIKQLKRQLARTLSIANQRLQASMEAQKAEK